MSLTYEGVGKTATGIRPDPVHATSHVVRSDREQPLAARLPPPCVSVRGRTSGERRVVVAPMVYGAQHDRAHLDRAGGAGGPAPLPLWGRGDRYCPPPRPARAGSGLPCFLSARIENMANLPCRRGVCLGQSEVTT